jgi:hypothetical protein
MSTTEEGWYFEDGDASVGIFGYLVVHEACEKTINEELPDNTNEGVTESTRRLGPENGLVTFVTTFTCKLCGAKWVITEQEPADPEEETNV